MYRCVKCNSPEVESLEWVDMNTGEISAGEVGEYYCRSCESHTDVYVHGNLYEDIELPEEKEITDEKNTSDS